MVLEDINDCDLYCPKYIIPFRIVDDKFPWYKWFKDRNLKGMVYAFCYKNVIIKIGCSYASFHSRSKENTSYGERLIRQINNLPGRFKLNPSDIYIDGYGFVPVSENGRDMVDIIQTYEEWAGIKIDRDQMYLHIWNITDVQSTKYFWVDDDLGNKEKSRYYEGLLVSQYKQDNKLPPIGNRNQDPSVWNHAFTKPKIAKESGNLIFFS